MSFYQTIENFKSFDFRSFFESVRDEDILKILTKKDLSHTDFLSLISPEADQYLEQIAQRANALTIQHFGRVIQLFMPLYIANYCSNHCVYCGFNQKNPIKRQALTLEEIDKEGKALLKTGVKHVLVLTGEDRGRTPPSYIGKAVRILRNYFPSVSIEVYPMEIDEYADLKENGVDGLTVYQEVYDETVYGNVHLKGRKSHYRYRLDTPERGARANLRVINIGALLGLGEKLSEIFYTGMHAKYLSDKYIDTEFCVSLPRINAAEGGYIPKHTITDREYVRFLLALRLFLPRVGITVSTREKSTFRNHLIPLGVTRFSAGSKTTVGGYARTRDNASPQFDVSDERSVAQVVEMINKKGYQPVYKDWTF